jgi:hypothetical protein
MWARRVLMIIQYVVDLVLVLMLFLLMLATIVFVTGWLFLRFVFPAG